MSDKDRVRAAMLTARRAADHAADDEAIAEATVDLVRGSARIAAYVPMAGEPGGPWLLNALAIVVGTVLLPVLMPDLDLDWGSYQGELVASARAARMLEPTGPRLGPEAVAGVDLVLVPAVAVDRSGVRLGRGGGSYDRALARVPDGVSVWALLYDGELVDALPAESHDRRVAGVVTPSGPHRLG